MKRPDDYFRAIVSNHEDGRYCHTCKKKIEPGSLVFKLKLPHCPVRYTCLECL